MTVGPGWIPENYDENDKPYRSRRKGRMKPKVDLSHDHPGYLKEIYDQSSSSSCVANATSAAYRYLARYQNSVSQDRLMDEPSRLFVYYNARLLPLLIAKKASTTSKTPEQPPQLEDKGTHNRDAFKGLNLYGVCKEKSWPFHIVKMMENGEKKELVENVSTIPPEDAYVEAKGSKAVEYCRLDPDHPAEVEAQLSLEEKKAVGIVTLIQLKQCLSEGYPVVFGFRYFWENPPWIKHANAIWELPALPAEQQHKGPPPGPPPDGFGSHAVLAIGYDESRKQVLCQNSWGPKWSRDGKFWIAYSWITDWEATDVFWMIRLIDKKRTTAVPPKS